MTDQVPRIRMFAGPNGSGKSTIKDQPELKSEWLGDYLNPDELERGARMTGYLDFRQLGIETSESEIKEFFQNHPLIQKANLSEHVRNLGCSKGRISFDKIPMNSYIASVATDFLRRRLMEMRRSFSFETVMSSPDKVELLKTAQSQGFRTYLYYVATTDPDINVARVAYRVSQGGHDVPEDKIRERYVKSLDLLLEAIRSSNRAYIFDNSSEKLEWLAEVKDKEIILRTTLAPAWFRKSVLDKLSTSAGSS